jgi:cystathionine beta-lyase
MKYNFDERIDRKGTNSIKWEAGDLLKKFGITERFDEDTISLFVADMDFQCPQPVIDALRNRVERRIFGYSTHIPNPDYFEAIQRWFSARHDWEINRESIIWCPGTVEAISIAVRAFSEAGQGIIIQQPVYSPFMSVIKGNKRKIVNNALINDNGYYKIDFEDLENKAQDPNNKMFILCSPHNPVGRVWKPEELIKMAEICIENDIILIADEIHGDLIRTESVHHPITKLVQNSKLISCTAINKTFNVAGLHCTNVIINDKVLRNRFNDVMGMKMPSPFGIEAVIAAYNDGAEWLEQVKVYLDDNFMFLDDFLKKNMPEVKFRIPEGTYIGWMDFRGYGLSSEEVHQKIYVDANVVLENGEMFGEEGKGFQRICIPSPRVLLGEAMDRISREFNK